MAFVVKKWIEWIFRIIQAIVRGPHVIYLLCTDSFSVAFCMASGFVALDDDYAPSEVLHLTAVWT